MYLKNILLKATTHINICKGNPQKNADPTYILRIPLTICGFHLQLRFLQQLNLTIQMFYHLFVDSTNCSGFRKFVYFRSSLSGTMILVFVCGIQNSTEDQRKVAMLRIPRKI